MFPSKRIIIAISLVIVAAFLLSLQQGVLAQLSNVSPDAIAIRVVPNPNHYSAMYWYQLQKFTGSPQSLEVDGYSAVRDGRTVYANAANIDGGTLYTNIYVISYNQEAERATIDILSQILTHWKFNNNLLVTGTCSLDSTVTCLLDSECAPGTCSSEKAQVVRDTRRLEGIAEIEDIIEASKMEKGKYPSMEAGSYIPGISISTWPSWQKNLANELGKRLPIDPVNTLGECVGYNPTTCWDEYSKEFVDSNISDGLDLPSGSSVYAYMGTPTGISYDICAIMESSYVGGAGSGNCNSGSAYGTGGVTGNNQPQFMGDNLSGLSGQEYSGFLQAIDPDGDPITWSVDVSGSTWVPNFWSSAPSLENTHIPSQKELNALVAGAPGTYTVAVTLDDGRGLPNSTNVRTYTISITNPPPDFYSPDYIYAASSTDPMDYVFIATDHTTNYPLSYSLFLGSLPIGTSDSFNLVGMDYEYRIGGVIDPVLNPIISVTNYPISIQIADVFGVADNDSFVITVTNNAPIFSLSDQEFLVGPTRVFNYTTNVTDPEHNYPLTFTTVSGVMPFNLVDTFVYNGSDYTFTINGIVDPVANPVPVNTVYSFNFRVTDEYGATANRAMNITLANNPPEMNTFNCSDTVRINNAYMPCTVSGTDPDGHAIASFDYLGLPPGMSGNPSTGVISGNPSVEGNYTVQVRPIDEYGAIGSYDSFSMTVYTYCGDNVLQARNMEERGGAGDNGYEFCDNLDGVAPNPAASGPDLQYACTTPPECALTGPCPNTCRHTGGYCGDATVQGGYGEDCDDGNVVDGDGCNTFSAFCQYACGDGTVSSGEDCDDGNNIDGDGCNTFSASCQYACGDGIVTGTEECELNETRAEYNTRTGSSLNAVEYEAFRLSCYDCAIGCTADPIGQGCFVWISGVETCQKGKYVCVSGVSACVDVFTPVYGYEIYDYCCKSIIETGSVGQGQVDLSTMALTRIKPAAAVSGAGNFYCDQVCAGTGQVCVGVGLTNNPSNYCYAVRCDSGNDCTASANNAMQDCKTTYPYLIDGDSCTNPEAYHVGYTSCLCY